METNLKPKVSIILPVYNAEAYIDKAIQSVLNQTFSDYELIIIDDGSIDKSIHLINNFKDPRIIFIKHTANQGLISTLNEGLQRAHGDYIARIDADDMWTDVDKLQKQITFLEQNTEYGVVGTWAYTIDENDKKIGTIKNPTTDTQIRKWFLIKNCLIHPSVLFRKDIALKSGSFLSDEKYVEDYGLWLRMGSFGRFANIPEYLMSYRIHSKSITQSKNEEQVKNAITLIKKHKRNYPHILLARVKWWLKK